MDVDDYVCAGAHGTIAPQADEAYYDDRSDASDGEFVLGFTLTRLRDVILRAQHPAQHPAQHRRDEGQDQVPHESLREGGRAVDFK